MKQKPTIIIVDDSKLIVERVIALLNEIPYHGTVLSGHNFEEGADLLENNKADIIMLDINLPGKSGIDLLKYIKEKNYPVSLIIMMTEDPSEAKKVVCTELGAHYFLNKLSDFEMIPDIIRGFAS